VRTAQALLGLAVSAWVHLVGGTLVIAVLATATLAQAPHPPLNTLNDVIAALRECWTPPPIDQSRAGMQITVQMSFRRNGELFRPTQDHIRIRRRIG
jgi:hypothetical protein